MLTCVASLFFQAPSAYHLCSRKLLLRHRTPFHQRYGNVWAYYFPVPHRIALRCANTSDQIYRFLILSAAGFLSNATGYHITSDGIQAFPELHGTRAGHDIPKVYLPENISVIWLRTATERIKASRNPMTWRHTFKSHSPTANVPCRLTPAYTPDSTTPWKAMVRDSIHFTFCRHNFQYRLLPPIPPFPPHTYRSQTPCRYSKSRTPDVINRDTWPRTGTGCAIYVVRANIYKLKHKETSYRASSDYVLQRNAELVFHTAMQIPADSFPSEACIQEAVTAITVKHSVHAKQIFLCKWLYRPLLQCVL